MNKVKDQDGLLHFMCPGCKSKHYVRVDGEFPAQNWTWNQSAASPTLSPSVLVTYDGADAGVDGAPPSRCHTFVTDGRINFLGDCTHAMRGWHDLPDLGAAP